MFLVVGVVWVDLFMITSGQCNKDINQDMDIFVFLPPKSLYSAVSFATAIHKQSLTYNWSFTNHLKLQWIPPKVLTICTQDSEDHIVPPPPLVYIIAIWALGNWSIITCIYIRRHIKKNYNFLKLETCFFSWFPAK